MEDRQVHPLDYLSVLRRRRWWFIGPLAISLAVGGLLAALLPREYVSRATLAVTSPRVSTDLVRTGSLDATERARAISQQLTSRAVLERVVREEGLAADRSVDAAISQVRRNVHVEAVRSVLPSSARSAGPDSMLVGYRARTPHDAQRVANRLAEVFVEEHSKLREGQAETTAEFIAAQLRNSQQRLGGLEEQLRAAKEAYMGRLPEQIGANLQMLSGLRQQQESTATSLRGEQDRLSMIDRQLEGLRQGAAEATLPTTPGGRIAEIQRDLARARTLYTARHPEIVRLEHELATARAELAETRELPAADRVERLEHDPYYRQLVADRERALLRIRELQRAEARIAGQIAQFQDRVEATPRVEQELTQVTREYELEKRQYAELAAKHQQALVSEEFERQQSGERFSVLYPAYVPPVADSPNTRRIMAMALVLGLILGAAGVVGREYLDRSVHDARVLEQEFHLPVLGEIPHIERVA